MNTGRQRELGVMLKHNLQLAGGRAKSYSNAISIQFADVVAIGTRHLVVDGGVWLVGNRGYGSNCNCGVLLPTQIPSSHHQVERKYYFDRIYPMSGNVLMADGSTRFFGRRPSRNELAALLSTCGGEQLGQLPTNNQALAILRANLRRRTR